MSKSDTPQAADDLERAEQKSRSVDERVPDLSGPGADPVVRIPGAFGTNMPQGGLGAAAPLDGADLGPGEAVLDLERKAQRTPTQRG